MYVYIYIYTHIHNYNYDYNYAPDRRSAVTLKKRGRRRRRSPRSSRIEQGKKSPPHQKENSDPNDVRATCGHD